MQFLHLNQHAGLDQEWGQDAVDFRRQLRVRQLCLTRGDDFARGGGAWARGWEAEPPCGGKVLGAAGLTGRGGQRREPPPVTYWGAASRTETK
jgi:hypothetical protein